VQSSSAASAAAAAAEAVDDDDDDDDDDDPFDIPEELDDQTGLAVGSCPDRKAAGVEKQTAELEMESMSSVHVERKEKSGRGKRDSPADAQSTPASRSGSGRRKVSIRCYTV